MGGGGGGGGKGGGKGGGSSTTRVTRYKLSIHYGVCIGPVDSLLALWYNEKVFWSGSTNGSASFYIDNPGAFGGDLQEGGAVGYVKFMAGGPNQVMDLETAGRLGREPNDCPAFRGIASIFFHGSSNIQTVSNAPNELQQRAASLRTQIDTLTNKQSVGSGQGYWDEGRWVPANGGNSSYWEEGHLVTVANGSLTYEEQQQLRSMKLELASVEAQIATYSTWQKYTGGDGFYWTANSPYIRGIWATVCRIPKALNRDQYPGWDLSRIVNTYDSKDASNTAFRRWDANPAHIIYECLTDQEWGMGASPSSIDLFSFNVAAQTLHNENFGISMMWSQQTSVENFVSEVIDHIDAALFVNPATGLLTLKLIRGDYSIADLETFDPSNSVLTNYQSKLIAETINEIVVTWTNPENEQEVTYTLQDLGNIAAQGAVVSDSRNYYGVRSLSLAKTLAARDLRVAATPLKTIELTVNRKAWNVSPAGVFRLTWPEHGIESIVFRVSKIDYGRPGQSAVKISAIEDIFSYAASVYGDLPQSEWKDTREPPRPIDFSRVVTLPSYMVRRILGSSISTWKFPSVMAGVLAAHDSKESATYDLLAERTLANGNQVFSMLSRRSVMGRGYLPDLLPAGSESVVRRFDGMIGGFGPQEGAFVWIAPDGVSERATEIALVKEVRSDGYVLWRGCLDTVPRAWPSGTPCWFVNTDTNFADFTERTAEVTQRYKLLTNTSLGQLAPSAAPILSAKLSSRPHLPLRPANVQVEGSAFTRVSVSTTAGSILVTWSNRNREYEDSQVLKWDTPPVPAEPGQTTTIYVYTYDGVPIAAFKGLTGNSFAVPLSAFGNLTSGSIGVFSSLGGMESFQGALIPVSLVPPPRLTINGAYLTINGNRIAMGGDSVPRLSLAGRRLRINGKYIVVPPGRDGTLRIDGEYLTINRQRVLML